MTDNISEIQSRAIRGPLHSIVGREGDYQCDITFLRYPDSRTLLKINHGYKALLVCIEVPSRFAYAVPLRSKDTEDVLEAFQKIFERTENSIKRLTTDSGVEFTNHAFQTFLHENEVIHYKREPGEHFALGIIDRFCRSIKKIIYDMQERERQLNWVDLLERAIGFYNTRTNRSLGFSPAAIRMGYIPKELIDKGIDHYKKFHIGDKVRVLIHPYEQERDNSRLQIAAPWHKGSTRWSNKVYTITDNASTDHSLGAWSWRLSDSNGTPMRRTYRSHELKRVSNDSVDVPDLWEDIAKEDRRAKRMKGEKIIEQERISYDEDKTYTIPPKPITERITEPIAIRKSERNKKKPIRLDL